MNRDMDLVRKILFKLEEKDSSNFDTVDVNGYDEDIVAGHIMLLCDAGLVADVEETRPFGGNPIICMPDRLTWQGHEYLDASRDEARWAKAKSVAEKSGGLTFDAFKQVLVKLMTEAAMSQIR